MQTLKPVDVICRFGQDGSIIPMRFQVTGEGQDAQTYTIRAYKPVHTHLESHSGYLKQYQTKSMIDFECKVAVFEQDKIIRLRYYIGSMEWKIIY